MKRRRVGFAEVELSGFATAGSYRVRIGSQVEVEVPRGFDPEEVLYAADGPRLDAYVTLSVLSGGPA
jgi:hypothetical protein